MSFTLLKPATRTEAEARASRHSPTPWTDDTMKVDDGQVSFEFVLIAANGEKVMDTLNRDYRSDPDEVRGNIEFVKLAVNSHDAMKAALIGAVTTLRRVQAADRAAAWPWIDEAISGVSAALDLARGAKP